jgi:hypothetical protein
MCHLGGAPFVPGLPSSAKQTLCPPLGGQECLCNSVIADMMMSLPEKQGSSDISKLLSRAFIPELANRLLELPSHAEASTAACATTH